MEQLVLETMSRHIKHKVIGSSQHRYVKEKSCLTKMIIFYNEVSGLDGERESSRCSLLDAEHRHRLLREAGELPSLETQNPTQLDLRNLLQLTLL